MTFRRRKFLFEPDNVELLRASFRAVKSAHPFTIDAFVLLPDHLHCIWTLPPGDHDYPMRWNGSKTISLAVAPIPLNYRLLHHNGVSGRNPFGNRVTGNIKFGMHGILKNIAITSIGIR